MAGVGRMNGLPSAQSPWTSGRIWPVEDKRREEVKEFVLPAPSLTSFCKAWLLSLHPQQHLPRHSYLWVVKTPGQPGTGGSRL
jgi:hypothetical protein